MSKAPIKDRQAVGRLQPSGRDRACHVRPSANSTPCTHAPHPTPVRPVPRMSDHIRTFGDVRWSHGRDGSVHTWTHETEGPEELFRPTDGRYASSSRRRHGGGTTT